MATNSANSIPTPAPSETPSRPVRSFRAVRWLNGGVHWISAFVLIYAFISNGETNRAMFNAVAMRGEVNLGLVVAFIFLIRFIWVRSSRSGGGRWLAPSIPMPWSIIRRITDFGIYIGVAASVVSGLLIAYLRPGAEMIREAGGFTTSSPALNTVIDTHASVSDALEWLCAFHVAYSLWHWLIKKTKWGGIAGDWVERAATKAGRVSSAYLQRLRP
jgi:cytochrome b561